MVFCFIMWIEFFICSGSKIYLATDQLLLAFLSIIYFRTAVAFLWERRCRRKREHSPSGHIDYYYQKKTVQFYYEGKVKIGGGGKFVRQEEYLKVGCFYPEDIVRKHWMVFIFCLTAKNINFSMVLGTERKGGQTAGVDGLWKFSFQQRKL